MRHVHKVVHVLVFTLTVHVWHLVSSDRMLDAATDVALDKAATVTLRVIHISGE